MKKFLVFVSLIFSTKLFGQFTPDSLVNSFIKEWINVPYRFGGSTKKGIDCSKFTQRLFKDVYDTVIPGVSWKQWNFSERISIDSLIFGDLVFFNSRLSPSGWHVGFYLGDGRFVHAANRKDDIKISSLNEENYIKNFKGGGRILNPKPESEVE
jgi:lipoprotein Spr